MYQTLFQYFFRKGGARIISEPAVEGTILPPEQGVKPIDVTPTNSTQVETGTLGLSATVTVDEKPFRVIIPWDSIIFLNPVCPEKCSIPDYVKFAKSLRPIPKKMLVEKKTPKFFDLLLQEGETYSYFLHVTSKRVSLLLRNEIFRKGLTKASFTFTKKSVWAGVFACGGRQEFDDWRKKVETLYKVKTPSLEKLISPNVRRPLNPPQRGIK